MNTCKMRKLKVIIEMMGRMDLQKQRSKGGGRGELRSHLLFYLSTTYLVVTCSCADCGIPTSTYRQIRMTIEYKFLTNNVFPCLVLPTGGCRNPGIRSPDQKGRRKRRKRRKRRRRKRGLLSLSSFAHLLFCLCSRVPRKTTW